VQVVGQAAGLTVEIWANIPPWPTRGTAADDTFLARSCVAFTALGMSLGWGWSRMVGRIVSWINVFLFAMLVVPDWDDAMASGAQGLHALWGVLAVYFLLCAMSLGFSSASRVKASLPDRR